MNANIRYCGHNGFDQHWLFRNVFFVTVQYSFVLLLVNTWCRKSLLLVMYCHSCFFCDLPLNFADVFLLCLSGLGLAWTVWIQTFSLLLNVFFIIQQMCCSCCGLTCQNFHCCLQSHYICLCSHLCIFL